MREPRIELFPAPFTPAKTEMVGCCRSATPALRRSHGRIGELFRGCVKSFVDGGPLAGRLHVPEYRGKLGGKWPGLQRREKRWRPPGAFPPGFGQEVLDDSVEVGASTSHRSPLFNFPAGEGRCQLPVGAVSSSGSLGPDYSSHSKYPSPKSRVTSISLSGSRNALGKFLTMRYSRIRAWLLLHSAPLWSGGAIIGWVPPHQGLPRRERLLQRSRACSSVLSCARIVLTKSYFSLALKQSCWST